jgi:hypothetical protein
MTLGHPLPPVEVLRETFNYDEVTGIITWRVKQARNINVGDKAGSYNSKGYLRIRLNYQSYPAARIAYAIYHGVDPYPMEVDHDNRNPADNSIGNLILTTMSGNCKNRDFTNHRPHLLRNNEAKSKPVRITYPDGEVIIAPSIVAAAKILGVTPQSIQPRLKRGDGIMKTYGRKPTGIVIGYEM